MDVRFTGIADLNCSKRRFAHTNLEYMPGRTLSSGCPIGVLVEETRGSHRSHDKITYVLLLIIESLTNEGAGMPHYLALQVKIPILGGRNECAAFRNSSSEYLMKRRMLNSLSEYIMKRAGNGDEPWDAIVSLSFSSHDS